MKILVCLALVAAALFFVAPRNTSLHAQGHVRIPLVTDWSHKHLVYSTPTTLEQTMRVRQDARYIQQYVRRNVSMKTPWQSEAEAQPNASESVRGVFEHFRDERSEPSDIHRDWSENLGAGASVGLNNFPAKFSFDTTTANCDSAAQPDFVAYNTSLAGAAPAEASGTGTFTGNPTNGQTLKITNGANVVTLTASLTVTATASVTINSQPGAGNTVIVGATTYTFETNGFFCFFVTNCVVSSGTNATTATNLADAIDNTCTGGNCTVTGANASATAAAAAAVVNLTAIPVGAAGNGIALSSTPASGTGAGHPFLDVAFAGGVTGSNTGTNFLVGGGATSDASNLVLAINRNNATIGVNATSAAGVVTITANATGPAGNAIALAETMTNFTVSGATLTGGTNGQASIVAFDNLYTGCPTTSKTVPAIYWQYDTGGTVVTSVTLSGDGSQLAFVQTQAGVATLVLLKWSSASSALTALTPVSNAAYVNCTAPCMTTIAFHNAPTDSNSSPFYVFDGTQGDTIYVGDDNGQLHKFHPIFGGTPAEITTAWPITVNATAGTVMTGPVFDSVSGNIFITDSHGDLSYVRDVGSTAGTCTAPCKGASIDVTQGGDYPIEDSPVVDSTSQRVFAFTDCSLAGDAGGTCGDGTSVAQVIQTTTALGSEVQANIGVASVFNNVHAGTFDNNFYSGNFGTGRLYACGNPGRTHDPILYILSFNTLGVMSTTVVTGPNLGTSGMNNQCSPITEAYNPNAVGGATDWIFVSVLVDGSPATCAAGGCLMNFLITQWQPTNVYALGQEVVDTRGNTQKVTTAGTSAGATPTWAAGTGGVTTDGTVRWTNQGQMAIANALAAPGGTSGIIIDNTVSTTGALSGVSQIYYSTLANGTCATSGGTGGCAVQASQAALH